ncbi:hypothetical protein [Kitasatospora sp. DSM 101779]|uniref:hypothetical protein n=1 Tax=Kitasatospora sp. DSM 101779 TaxID=2853165 RepID=UPI0021D8E0E2|nr:hypothetical protein [Kitasatospora sp. DSM 101779]MCU7820566.1 hypothetical protein [Kitasatospora sp. DSM 101779]
MSTGTLLVDTAVAGSVAAALWQAPRVLRRAAPPGGANDRRGATPEAALTAVTALIHLNQLLVTVYLLQVHGGDASFVARLLPPGWFDLADGPAVRELAAHVPAPELLAPSLFRAPALLELPFVLLVFLSVLRRLDPAAYRQAALSPMLGLAAASYTAVFCTVEWQLRTPWTEQDIALRLLSAVLTPPAVAALVRRDARAARAPSGPPGTAGLLLFAVELAALGHLVLTVYDTALLYNLGRLPERLPGAAAAVALLAATALLRRRFPAAAGPAAGPATGMLADGLRRSLVLFFVPALAIRYGVNFGTPLLAAAAGLLVLLAAAVPVLAVRPRTAALALAPAALAALLAAAAAVRLTAGAHYETALLGAAVASLAAAVLTCGLADRLTRPGGGGPRGLSPGAGSAQ